MSDIVERVEERIRYEPTLKTLQVLQDSVAEIVQLRAELAEARDKALDEAVSFIEAKIQVQSSHEKHPTYWGNRRPGNTYGLEYAQAIRALKSPKPQETTMSEGVGG